LEKCAGQVKQDIQPDDDVACPEEAVTHAMRDKEVYPVEEDSSFKQHNNNAMNGHTSNNSLYAETNKLAFANIILTEDLRIEHRIAS